MKTLLFISTFILIVIFSCEKEPDCWTCEIITNKTGEDTRTTITKKCGTASDIFRFEAENTYIKEEKKDMGPFGVWITVTEKSAKCRR